MTDDGEQVVLPAIPGLSPRRPPTPGRTAQRRGVTASAPDCPATVSCEWIPAAYKQLKEADTATTTATTRPVRSTTSSSTTARPPTTP
ncbi:hypothetical protein ACFQX6_65055 [Streptosporangium lutulentum]